MENIREDLVVTVMQKVSGGIYNNVEVNGAGKIKGELKCSRLEVDGILDIEGDTAADNIEINGALKLQGNLSSKEIDVSGSVKGTENIMTDKIEVAGSLKLGKSLHCNEVIINGMANIEGDCEAEVFRAYGVFELGGLLNAEDILINSIGKSRAKEIGGEKIDIRRLQSNDVIGKMLISKKHAAFETEVIEGGDIYLEDVNASIVRGNNVTIGANCKINVIEYKNQLNMVEGSVVKYTKKG